MAAPAFNLSRSLAGISRRMVVRSSYFIQLRNQSDLEGKDSHTTPSTISNADTDANETLTLPCEPILSLDSPQVAEDVAQQAEPEKDVKPSTDTKSTYPPRTFRTPRGVYKAIVLGEVGQLPVQKILKSGKSVTIFSVGTGGMYNNRRPFEGESPEEFAERSFTQWHRVAVYQDRVAGMVMQHVKVGSQVYLEGNIESRVYNDPNTGIVKRIREIAIRSNGRLMFMDIPTAAPAAASTTSS